MQKKQMPDFTIDRVFKDDGTLEFRCSYDLNIWPWQALHPHDPIYLQTINFWTPFEAGIARGEYSTEKWTALTETCWELGSPDIEHPVRGIAEPVDKDNFSYAIKLFDAKNKLVYQLTGKGVVFQNRDFGAWRQTAKDKIATLPKPDRFAYASHKLTGAPTQSQSFISDVAEGKTAQALVTEENGLIPHHPYLTGSGDHVNATHLHVLGEQFATILSNGRKLSSPSGKMSFNRYVELNHPIDIVLKAQTDNSIEIAFYQAEQLCAGMTFNYSAV